MDPIAVTALNIIGRVTVRDPNLGNTYGLYNADFSVPVSYAIQFGTQSQGQVFGVVKSMFLDNGNNPSPVEVLVQGTDQFFTIPAYSIGTYTIDANAGSTITLTSEGGATDICTVTFYNWERPPVVWYSFGAFNTDRPIKAQGTMSEGDDIAVSDFNDPVFIGGRKPDGTFVGLNTDADGNIVVSNLDITIGAVYGPDLVGTPPTHPGVLTAVLDNTGDVVNLTLTPSGKLPVEATIVTDNPDTGAITSVASVITDATILAANANRKGAIIFNNSTSALNLALANVNATVSYSVVVAAGGEFFLGNGDYTGVIKGTWVSVNGAAIVTELV